MVSAAQSQDHRTINGADGTKAALPTKEEIQ
jgi:hypothetical protein